jgi:uncharacterized membrane protein|tara:strand:+ start:1557 stop:1811 length:255 start_codon:yes stop_codon:yes gene_type:complete
MDVVTAIKDFGFPIVAAVGMLYMIYFVWKTITEEVEKYLQETMTVLIGLIDRIRMLDNDIIRLQQKLDTAIEMKRKGDEETNKD